MIRLVIQIPGRWTLAIQWEVIAGWAVVVAVRVRGCQASALG